MAAPTLITLADGHLIVQNYSSGSISMVRTMTRIPNKGAVGTVVQADPGATYAVNDLIVYTTDNAVQFRQSPEDFICIPVTDIVFKFTEPA